MIIRAAVTDRDLVSAWESRFPSSSPLVFALGIFLAGIAGGAYAPLSTISVGMDVSLLIESFAVIIVGGVGRLSGTLLGLSSSGKFIRLEYFVCSGFCPGIHISYHGHCAHCPSLWSTG